MTVSFNPLNLHLLSFVSVLEVHIVIQTVKLLFGPQGMYGISDQVFLSLPCVLNSGGVVSVVNMTLTEDEVTQLQASAGTLWDIQKDLRDV